MRVLAVLLMLLIPVQGLACGGSERCEVEGGYYLASVPEGWDGISPLPLVVFFHGWNSSPEGMFRNRAMVSGVNRRGALFVVPYARTGYWRQIGEGRAERGRDEKAYTEAVMADVARRWPIDPKRTLASGFSRGASMVWNVACYLGSSFAGYAPIAGGFWGSTPADCPSGPVNMRHIHGNADREVAYDRIGIYNSMPIPEGLATIRRENGCAAEPLVTRRDGRLTCQRWQGCASGRLLEVCLHDGGHSIPAEWVAEGLDWMLELPPEAVNKGSDTMNLGMTERVEALVEKVRAMVTDEIAPLDAEFHAEIGKTGNRFEHTPRMIEILDGLKATAKERGLWNFWLTDSAKGYGLSTVEYAYLAEEMGKVRIAAEVFNCSAPDTGNMEVFERYGTEAMKARWLKPLLNGEIRSAYAMTEPDVASSDATNVSLHARRDGDHWVLNGEKWWISGAGDPRCKVYITMTRTNPEADRHKQHTQFAIAADTPGIEVLRPMEVYGHDDAPHGHMQIRFTDVRVPHEDMILGEGRGFEVAQGRLGPGRIHHCMRAIGQAERALELMCRRSLDRTAFGKPLAQLGANFDIIANARMEIEQARLLCLKAAYMMDTVGVREAQPWISMIKVVAPNTALAVIDESVQMQGARGISQDVPLAHMWTHVRTLRFADGPDAVHRRQVARRELRQYAGNTKI